MTNLEIARLFNEEDAFKRNVMETLLENNGYISMGYCIFPDEHKPYNDDQRKYVEENGDGEIQLFVDINIDDLID